MLTTSSDGAVVSKYIHRPIVLPRAIRVLTLLPSRSRKAPLHGIFSEHSLDSSTIASFEALSYVWGSIESPDTITIVKQDVPKTQKTAGQLTITSNCASALRRLRYCFCSRRIWVDAICIDQESTLEKNDQVGLMIKIYDKTKRVLVWLRVDNEEEAQTREVFRLIKLVAWLYKKGYLELDNDENTNMPEMSLLAQGCTKYVRTKEHELSDAIRALFMNRYLWRIWTVQEIAMAHQVKVYYGAFTFTWAELVICATSFIYGIQSLSKLEDADTLESFSKIRQGLDTHFANPHISTVVALCDKQHQGNIYQKLEKRGGHLAVVCSKGLEATEPKDQAYAMLWAFRSSKVSNLATSPLQVDYNKSLETIYTEYTAALINTRFDMLYLLGLVNSRYRNPSLPSWVPDWNEETSTTFLLWIAHLNYYKASKRSEIVYYPGPFSWISSNLLVTRGTEFSKIKAVIRYDELHTKDSSLGLNLPHRRALQFSRLVRDVINAGRIVSNTDDESLIRALYTSFLGYDASNSDGTATKTTETDFHIFNLRICSLLIPLIDHALGSPESQRVREELGQFLPKETIDAAFQEAEHNPDYPLLLVFLHGVLRSESWINECTDRWPLHHLDKDFFITESGNLGMAYHGVEEGDLVAIWSGRPCPTVMRKKSVGGMKAYHFHGVAYVDGIMNGEAWPETEEELQMFILV